MTFEEKMQFVDKMLAKTSDRIEATKREMLEHSNSDYDRKEQENISEMMYLWLDWVKGVSFELATIKEELEEINNKL